MNDIDKIFIGLVAYSDLTNEISREALANARHNYAKRGDVASKEIAGDLYIVIRQVSNRDCRINPSCWFPLVSLHQYFSNLSRKKS